MNDLPMRLELSRKYFVPRGLERFKGLQEDAIREFCREVNKKVVEKLMEDSSEGAVPHRDAILEILAELGIEL